MKDTVTFRRTISIKGDKATVITESKIKLLKNLSLNIQSFLILDIFMKLKILGYY